MGGRGGGGVDIFGKKTCGQAPLLEQKESTEALILAYECFLMNNRDLRILA